MLNWANRFNICAFLDNHQYKSGNKIFECLAGVGALQQLELQAGTALEQLTQFQQASNDWCFGHLGYDLKNEIEDIHSFLPDHIGFPDLFFFIPEIVLQLNEHHLRIGVHNDSHNSIFNQINTIENMPLSQAGESIIIKARFTKEEYLVAVREIMKHIQSGNCYEVNFCQEFYASDIELNPLNTYLQLTAASPNPFAAFYKIHDKFVLCASPERFLQRKGNRLLAQPVKGTMARGVNVREEREELLKSQKDKNENVMVVDLVRNDLSKVCEKGTVTVEELFGIYSFPQVHQMISSVTGLVNKGMTIGEIIRATFPMGSMTGAPKKKVMSIIETYERSKRGLFSGSIGYITPSADFDFNVVIRSVFYNQQHQYISFQAGSAITSFSEPEEEYQECLLKAATIKKVLAAANTFLK